jgi:hypothetical protein
MIDYRELDALAKDTKRANATAAMLLELEDTDWNGWESDFLENMSACRSTLSTRQAEVLIELRDASVLLDKMRGFSLKALIDRLWMYRDELTEEGDVEFVCQLKESGAAKLRKRQAAKLLAIARKIDEA